MFIIKSTGLSFYGIGLTSKSVKRLCNVAPNVEPGRNLNILEL